MTFSKLLNMIFALGLLIILSSSQAKSKEYKLELLDLNSIDLCGKEFQKEVIIAPTIGNILRSDSLIGFELSLSYDPAVIKMNKILTINTHADGFQYTQMHTDGETGEIVFEGAVDLKGFPKPISGDRPLIGFGGNFIGDCFDSTVVKVNYFFTFDDFKGSVDADSELEIIGSIVDKPTRAISFEIMEDHINLKKDSITKVNVNLDLGEMSSLEYWKIKANIDSDSVRIDSVNVKGAAELIDVTNSEDNGYYIELKVNDATDVGFELSLLSSKIDSSEVRLDLETVETTECICATNFPNYDKTFYNLETEDTTSSVDYSLMDYTFENGILFSKSNSINIDVYSIVGRRVDSKVCNVNDVYDLNLLGKGIYIIKVTTDNVTKIYKKINN